MTTTTHTPGPWRRQIIAPTFEHTAVETADGKLSIARVYKKADARLITAAPELLRILEQAVNRGYMWDHDADLWSEANAAVRAAKGG